MNLEHCDQCKHQCSVDALRCNKGRIHFGLEPVEAERDNGPLGLLQACGFILHHSGIHPQDALSALTVEEQAELERLLSTLVADWKARMPEAAELSRHRQGRHGRRDHRGHHGYR